MRKAFGAYGMLMAVTAAFAPARAAEPSEDFYLSECLGTGYEIGICQCLAKAYAPAKDAKADAVAAIMVEYVLMGEDSPAFADVKRDLTALKIAATDAEIQKALDVAKSGASCLQR
jgi:hypothetical protein